MTLETVKIMNGLSCFTAHYNCTISDMLTELPGGMSSLLMHCLDDYPVCQLCFLQTGLQLETEGIHFTHSHTEKRFDMFC